MKNWRPYVERYRDESSSSVNSAIDKQELRLHGRYTSGVLELQTIVKAIDEGGCKNH